MNQGQRAEGPQFKLDSFIVIRYVVGEKRLLEKKIVFIPLDIGWERCAGRNEYDATPEKGKRGSNGNRISFSNPCIWKTTSVAIEKGIRIYDPCSSGLVKE